MSQQVGLFGRHPPGLVIPEWVTMFVSFESVKSLDNSFLVDMAEAIATVGVRGISVVLRSLSDPENERSALQSAITYFGNFIRVCRETRPYFTAIVCDENFMRANADSVLAGRGLYLRGEDGPLVTPPWGEDEWCIAVDVESGLVGKTSRPSQMLRDAVSAAEAVWDQPHWKDIVSAEILRQLIVLLSVNMLCKPESFVEDSLLFTGDFADQLVAEAFNNFQLRARWESSVPTAGAAS
jgi:hypothetical protein